MPRPEVATFLEPGYLSALLGAEVVKVAQLPGGRNSNTCRITTKDGTRLVAKQYLGKTADGRSRAEAEFSSLTFLARMGIDGVPRPLAIDQEMECAVYEYLDGEPVLPKEVTEENIQVAAKFLLRLNELKDCDEAVALPPAAEACFSFTEMTLNIDGRLQMLRSVARASVQDQDLHRFLDTEFIPARQTIEEWGRRQYLGRGLDPAELLELSKRTLSPSDFGFHNCLKQAGGGLVFLDFEYFGWDDPAKMISDFLLHPGMTLSDTLKQKFLAAVMPGFDGGEELAHRVATLYPMFGLKWCLILLNEFLPERVLRRQQADGLPQDPRPGQLDKAKEMLRRIMSSYEHFPYWKREHVAVQR